MPETLVGRGTDSLAACSLERSSILSLPRSELDLSTSLLLRILLDGWEGSSVAKGATRLLPVDGTVGPFFGKADKLGWCADCPAYPTSST